MNFLFLRRLLGGLQIALHLVEIMLLAGLIVGTWVVVIGIWRTAFPEAVAVWFAITWVGICVTAFSHLSATFSL